MLFIKSIIISIYLRMLKKIFFVPFIALFSFKKAHSQTSKLDSINFDKVNFYKNTNIDSLFFYCDKLEKSNNICKKLEAKTGRAYGYYIQKNYTKAEKITRGVIEFVDSLNQSLEKPCLIDRKIASLNRLFWIKKNQEKYEEAYAILIEKENQILNHPVKDQLNFRNQLGLKLSKAVIKNKLGMHDKAKVLLLNSIAEIQNPIVKNLYNDDFFIQWQANVYNCLGNTYIALNGKNTNPNKTLLDSATYYYDKAYNTSKLLTPIHKDSKLFYNFRKTEILLAKKEYKKAIELINNYKNINNGCEYKHREYFQKAICFHNLNVSDSAIYYASKIIKDKKYCKTSKLITMYDILSNQYNKIHKIDSAYKYSSLNLKQYELARKNKDKTFNLFYDNNFNKAQKLNLEIKENGANKERKLILTFFALLIILATILLFVYKKEKNKKERLITKINNQQQPIEVEKKEYNIDDVLENKILDKIKNINENYEFLDSNFSISSITKDLETNSTYVSFVFNKHYKESFKQYFTRRKIDYIINKLRTDGQYRKYSIQGLAQEVGYTNASAFSRAFKKQVGITPSAFLKTLD